MKQTKLLPHYIQFCPVDEAHSGGLLMMAGGNGKLCAARLGGGAGATGSLPPGNPNDNPAIQYIQ